MDYPPEAGKTYFYMVTGIFGGVDSSFFDPKKLGNVIRVIVPPDNMALVHRWIANQDICGMMQRGGNGNNCNNSLADSACCDLSLPEGTCSDIDNHYRCKFNGLASTVDEDGDGNPDPFSVGAPDANYNPAFVRYYDLGKDLLVDRFEMGGKFTLGGCNAGGDCMGDEIPPGVAGISVDNDLIHNGYFMRRTSTGSSSYGMFYIRPTGNPNWYQDFSGALLETDFETTYNDLYSNSAYLPPAFLHQNKAHYICKGKDSNVDGNAYEKRLLNRKEFNASSAWPAGWTSLEAYDVERRTGTNQGCNDGTTGNTVVQLPVDYTTNIYSRSYASYYSYIRTGSNGGTALDPSTALCVLRYGVQDMVGNPRFLESWYLSC